MNRLVAAGSPATQCERVWPAVVWQASHQVARDTFLEYDTPGCDQADDYDLWIGDESFVGWLPMPDGGDRAIFVGDPDDIVPDAFGPGLPPIRDWTRQHYDFAGYITGFDPRQLADRQALGYRDDERLCIVTVGGSGVGGHLLRRVIAAFPEAKERVPDLRMIVVTGPRIDPGDLPAHDGLEIRPYVHELHRHLAACDLAVVRGGLTTTMELTAARRPFIYFPLGHHFEQNFHVRHRLDRYRAGRCMDYQTTGPAEIAAAIDRKVDARSPPTAPSAPRPCSPASCSRTWQSSRTRLLSRRAWWTRQIQPC